MEAQIVTIEKAIARDNARIKEMYAWLNDEAMKDLHEEIKKDIEKIHNRVASFNNSIAELMNK